MLYFLHIWNFVVLVIIIAFLQKQLRYIWDKQDQGTLLVFFLAGCTSVLFVYIFSLLFTPLKYIPLVFHNNFTYHIFVTGPLEETTKFLCFLFIAHPTRSIKEPQDGVLQGAAVGIAFGFIENLLYFDRFPGLFIAIRPILTTTGHGVYGGIWGGMYSAAVYSNHFSKDRTSYLYAAFGLGLTSLLHGLYNGIVSFSLWGGIGLDVLTLGLSVWIFLWLVNFSPYKSYPLSQAKVAIKNIQRGLYFNPKSAILHRNLGMYLMHLGKYKKAYDHLTTSMARTYDPRRARFFSAVCGLVFLSEFHSLRQMRIAWARLTDQQRKKYLSQLSTFLENDEKLLKHVYHVINSAFKLRPETPGYILAKELKMRKYTRRWGRVNPILDEIIYKLSPDERSVLAKKME